MKWWFCLLHQRVEQGPGCADQSRLGPYETRDAAEGALRRMQARNEALDSEDSEQE
ncbi:MAG: hypothetical protein KGQ38_05600 [Actinomycetales bacterium]|nr:hypothetical protein [Actinomycetales bacterium]